MKAVVLQALFLLLPCPAALAESPPDGEATRSGIRAVALGGASFTVERAGLVLGAGIEPVRPGPSRFTFRVDSHIFRTANRTWHATTGQIGLKLLGPSASNQVRPYLHGTLGYGTARSLSDFALPIAMGIAGGLEWRMPDERVVFLEFGVLGVRETTIYPLRVGAMIP